jgi:hypothetical protein
MSQHPFDRSLALKSVAPGREAGQTSPDYWNMIGPFGGWTAATVLQAVMKHPQRLGVPLSITVNYAAALSKGEFEVQLHPARTNRSTQHWTAAIVQKDEQGEPSIVVTATIITAVRRETWSMSDLPMPVVPAPLSVAPVDQGRALAWLERYELRPIAGGLPKAWDGKLQDHSLSQLWLRDVPHRLLDYCSVLALSDVFFPRVWLRRAQLVPAGTVSLTTYFHAGEAEFAGSPQGFVLGQARAQEFRNGFFDQSSQLWNEAGTLLCTSHQIVYYKE